VLSTGLGFRNTGLSGHTPLSYRQYSGHFRYSFYQWEGQPSPVAGVKNYKTVSATEQLIGVMAMHSS